MNGNMKNKLNISQKSIIIFIIVIFLSVCFYYNYHNEYVDMSGYKTYSSTMDNVYKDYTVKQLDKDIKNNKSMIVYFGFSNCPYCNDLLPILTEITNKYNQKIYYIDTRKKSEWKSNIDIDDYNLLTSIIGDYLTLDEDNILHLYVPTIIFINKGEIKSFISPYEYDIEKGLPEDIKIKIYNDLDNKFNTYYKEKINEK